MVKRDWILLGIGIIIVGLRLLSANLNQVIYKEGQVVRVVSRIDKANGAGVCMTGFWLSKFRGNVGDKLTISGVLTPATGITLNACGDWEIKQLEIEKIEPVSGLRLWLAETQAKTLALYGKLMPEPEASLVAGVVWGGANKLPAQLNDYLKNTGTTHVVSASGMNVSMTAMLLMVVLTIFLTRHTAIVAAMAGIAWYTIMAGGVPSVVRAGIMAEIFLVSQLAGRQYGGGRILAIAVVLMLLWNPEWLTNLGWQLSVASTFGLFLFGERTKSKEESKKVNPIRQPADQFQILRQAQDKFFNQAPSINGTKRDKFILIIKKVWGLVGEDLGVSLAATLATLPIMLGNFGRLSIFSPVINALVLWTVGPLMVIGFVIYVFGMIWLPLAQPFAWMAWALAKYFIITVEFFGKNGWGVAEGITFPWWLGVGYWGGLLWLAKSTKYKVERRK